MDITKKIVEQLLAGTFTSEFTEITLTQQISDNPKVFTGAGYLYYNDNIPHLKFLHTEIDPQTKATATYCDLSYGDIIEGKYLFSLSAIDLHGVSWQAKDVDPFINMHASQQGISIDCRLDEIIRKTERNSKKYTTHFITPQKLKIPCNLFQDLGEGGKRRVRSSFELGKIKVSILLEDDFTSIHLESDDMFSFEYATSILDSLCVASGCLLSPALVVMQDNNINSFIFRHIDNYSKSQLMEFIPQRNPLYLNDWVQFSQAYIKAFEVDKTFYYYWLKVFNAHQSDLENETLSLTVSIEGVINKFHSDFKVDDVEFYNLCGESKSAIKNLDINDRVKSSIISLLERSGKSSVKGTLFNMADKGIFSKDLARTWFKARNRSAHAEHFKKHAWQENFNNYSSCLTLFYILLVFHIDYKGMFFHYHLPDAPMKNLNFLHNK